MKILCVIDSLGSGGAQRQLVQLAIGFKEKGHDVSFLIYHNLCFFKHELDLHDINVKIIEDTNFLKRILKMRKYIRNLGVDGVISFLESPSFICELSGFPSRKWRLIVGERSADPRIFKSIKRLFYRWIHIFSDIIVTNSYANTKMIKKIVPFLLNKKTHVIYNLLDKNYWVPSKTYKPLKNGKIEVVVAASHIHYKNSIGLIEAVQRLSVLEKEKLRINWYGKIGDDNSFLEAKKLISLYNLDKVIKFHEPSTNMNSIYSHCDAVGLFSLLEGLPNTVCEGMITKKPVIASNVSDVPKLINIKEAIFNPNDINEIKDSLSWLIGLEKEDLLKIGKKNRSNALTLFNKDTIINSYLNHLKK
jgi:glycosyltransferase involved in cell wall biosynthesis